MKLRHFLFFLALVVIVVFGIFQFGQIQSFVALLSQAHWWLLLVVVALRYLYYRSNTRFFLHFFDIFKKKIDFSELFRIVITMNFVNIVFPSGGISGISYLRRALRGRVDSTEATLGQLVWYVISFVCYIVLLLLGFIVLVLSNRVIRVSSRLIILVLFILLLVGVVSTVLLLSRGLSENVAIFIFRPINFVLHKLHRQKFGKERIKSFVQDMHDSIEFLRTHYLVLGKPTLDAFLMIVYDIASIYVVFLAFGSAVNPGVVISGYTIALISSLASVFTAGIGAYEAGMVATFVGLGVGFSLAFSVTIVYRAIALWLFLPVGLYFYKRTLLDKAD